MSWCLPGLAVILKKEKKNALFNHDTCLPQFLTPSLEAVLWALTMPQLDGWCLVAPLWRVSSIYHRQFSAHSCGVWVPSALGQRLAPQETRRYAWDEGVVPVWQLGTERIRVLINHQAVWARMRFWLGAEAFEHCSEGPPPDTSAMCDLSKF